jgi:hypothetical protein
MEDRFSVANPMKEISETVELTAKKSRPVAILSNADD